MSLETIKALVEELTILHVTLGVQPGDLADNIFEDSYIESVSRKTKTGAIFEITFEELDEDSRPSRVTMRYTYDLNRYLILVEQKVSNKKFRVQWDRADCIKEKIEKLENLLNLRLPEAQVAKIISTIPRDFLKHSSKLQLVA